jgi:hypothetical protein
VLNLRVGVLVLSKPRDLFHFSKSTLNKKRTPHSLRPTRSRGIDGEKSKSPCAETARQAVPAPIFSQSRRFAA